MKIPETQPNVGAYYGNEENGQWQPNGVIIDSGVGGGVVGSGDAGVHRYPVHIPRGHIPSYVMAGAYYPPALPAGAPPHDDFADYMWMENEDEFDKQVMQQLEEEALMEQCIEAMLEDEQRERQRPAPAHAAPAHNGHAHYPTSSNGAPAISLEEAVSRSTLNPLAAEFVPSFGPRPTVTEEKTEPADTKTDTESKESTQSDAPVEDKEQSRTEESPGAPPEPPEVSAADVQPDDKKPAKKDAKKTDAKKPAKAEPKAKTKAAARAEPKPAKKKDAPADEPAPEQHAPAFKPINYAAAAKASKPKKPASPPADSAPAPAAAPAPAPAPAPKERPKDARKNSAK